MLLSWHSRGVGSLMVDHVATHIIGCGGDGRNRGIQAIREVGRSHYQGRNGIR